MNRLFSFFNLAEQLFRKASVRDVILLSIAIAIGCIIALVEIQSTRRRVRNLLLAQDRQARAMTVLASRLDSMSQQMAQYQFDQVKRREQGPVLRTDATADVSGLRKEIESLRREIS